MTTDVTTDGRDGVLVDTQAGVDGAQTLVGEAAADIPGQLGLDGEPIGAVTHVDTEQQMTGAAKGADVAAHANVDAGQEQVVVPVLSEHEQMVADTAVTVEVCRQKAGEALTAYRDAEAALREAREQSVAAQGALYVAETRLKEAEIAHERAVAQARQAAGAR